MGGWSGQLTHSLRKITNLTRCTTFNRFLSLELPRRLIRYTEISVKSSVMKRFNLNFCHTRLMDGWMIIIKKLTRRKILFGIFNCLLWICCLVMLVN